jgi:hypothetical protein
MIKTRYENCDAKALKDVIHDVLLLEEGIFVIAHELCDQVEDRPLTISRGIYQIVGDCRGSLSSAISLNLAGTK